MNPLIVKLNHQNHLSIFTDFFQQRTCPSLQTCGFVFLQLICPISRSLHRAFRSKAFRSKSCVGECATVTQRLLLVFQDTRWKLPQYIFSPKVCVRWQGWATQWSESYCLGWNPKRVIQWQLRYKSWITSGFPTESCVILWYNLLVMRFHLLTAITCRLQQDHLGFKVGRPCQQISFAATWLWFPMPLLCWWMVKRMSGDLSSWADGDQSVRCLVWFGRFHVNRCINKYICIYIPMYILIYLHT